MGINDYILNLEGSTFSKLPFTYPPNAVWIVKNLAIDETEVSNFAWLEFLNDIIKDSTKEYYNKMLPDRDVIELLPSDYYYSKCENKSYKNYIDHPEYWFFPVVGVSFYQVNEYCKWRSRVVTEHYNTIPEVKKSNRKFLITYRLPSESEWERAASNGADIKTFPYGYSKNNIQVDFTNNWVAYCANKIQKRVPIAQIQADIKTFNKGENSIINYNCSTDRQYFYDFKTPFHCNSFYPNVMGLYNIIGNVAEMIDQEGIAKGGSWQHKLEDCNISKRIYYSSPTSFLGFRCVCVIEEEK